jgi:hypothetical protein
MTEHAKLYANNVFPLTARRRTRRARFLIGLVDRSTTNLRSMFPCRPIPTMQKILHRVGPSR